MRLKPSHLFLAAALVILVMFESIGPLRVVVATRCAVDRYRHGSERSVGSLSVSLPKNWCEDSVRDSSGTSGLQLIRIPRTRSSRNTLAVVRPYNGEFDDEKGRAAIATLKWSTDYFGQWEPKSISSVDLGGDSGYEIRFQRIGSQSNSDDVSADFIAPKRRIWISCLPMSSVDLEECRTIASKPAP